MSRLTGVTVIEVLILTAALLAVIVVVGVNVLRTGTPYRRIDFDTVTRR
jgi:hypothetical protein